MTKLIRYEDTFLESVDGYRYRISVNADDLVCIEYHEWDGVSFVKKGDGFTFPEMHASDIACVLLDKFSSLPKSSAESVT